MIDPHVHLRDWNQKNKETVKHGLSVAERAGLDAVFDMPNTDPALITVNNIEQRIKLAESAESEVFYGLYAGLTADPEQIKEVINIYNRLFPKIVGFKLFAGKSTGNLAVISEEKQKIIFETLNRNKYKGLVAVHCEKESLINNGKYSPEEPFTHAEARPQQAETESIKDIIKCAESAGFKGTVNICHVSLSESVNIINNASAGFNLTCGVTPHHLLLNEDMMKQKDGFLLKMNPPLRKKKENGKLLKMLSEEKINWIETDHAPHKLSEKRVCSGIPGFPVYPLLIKWLFYNGFSRELIEKITHDNIQAAFNIEIKKSRRNGELNLFDEYEFDAYEFSKDIQNLRQ
jgi:dihydroorotase